METNVLLLKLQKLEKLYQKITALEYLDIKTIHKLRTKTREVISCIDKKDSSYKKLKKVIKLTNEIRDIDVFQEEFLKTLPPKYIQNINIDSMVRILQEQRKDESTKLISYLGKLDMPSKITATESIKNSINCFQKKVIPKLGDKQLHKYRIYIKSQLYYYKVFYPNKRKQIKKLTKIKDYLGFIIDNLNAKKRVISHYPSIEKELNGYIQRENQELFEKVLKLDTTL